MLPLPGNSGPFPRTGFGLYCIMLLLKLMWKKSQDSGSKCVSFRIQLLLGVVGPLLWGFFSLVFVLMERRVSVMTPMSRITEEKLEV